MIAFAGLWPRLGALVVAIPKPIASAMLAGVLLKLCLAPFIALKALPVTAGAVILVWLILMRFARSAAVPVAALVALVSTIALAPPGTYDGVLQWPQVTLTTPTFSLEATVSLALPLFFVTMASQNITGLAVLATFGYHLKTSLAFVSTGLASVVIAPFGAPTVNLAAVTAALAAGPDAGPDPQKRYVAAVFSGIGYIMLALIAGLAAATVTRAPPLLIEAVAGLALIGAFSNAALAALNKDKPAASDGPVVVLVMEKDRLADYQKMAQSLRQAGIRAEMYLGTAGMKAQMKYADKRGAPCVVIQGGDERARGEVQIKDLIEGAKAAATIKDSKQWREGRPAQVSVKESELVARVREVLARHGG